MTQQRPPAPKVVPRQNVPFAESNLPERLLRDLMTPTPLPAPQRNNRPAGDPND